MNNFYNYLIIAAAEKFIIYNKIKYLLFIME